MRLLVTLFALLVFVGSALAQSGPATAPAAASKAAKDSGNAGSYGIGLNVGRSIREDGLEVDLEAFVQGVRDGIEGVRPRYTDDQLRAALQAFQRDMQAKHQTKQQAAAEKNLREGQAFLAKNKSAAGVKSLPSGLQYQVLRAGKGTPPKASDTVKVHYEGTLLDGTVFDSSIRRKQPAEFQVGGVIPGWTEALQLMKPGDKWKLFIPAELAYGAAGAGGVIGPNAVLVFEVELLEIEAAPAAIR